MIKLEILLKEEQPQGAYVLGTDVKKEAVREIVEKHGFTFFFIDGEKVTDKESFLSESQISMHFPDYFGMNWDALNDCLMDFSWNSTKKYVILYKDFQNFARRENENFLVAIRIMNGVAQDISDNAKMCLLLQGDMSTLPSEISQLDEIVI